MDAADKDGTIPKYYGKGMTGGFVTAEYEKALKSHKPLTKR